MPTEARLCGVHQPKPCRALPRGCTGARATKTVEQSAERLDVYAADGCHRERASACQRPARHRVSRRTRGRQEGAPKADPFAPLRFLAGTWRGDQSGQPGQGTAERTYQFILNDRFLQETNTSTYPPQEKNKKGEVHHHMSMISYDGMRKLFVFRQFHTKAS